MLFDTLKELILSVKARDILRFLAAWNNVGEGLLKSFGSVDKVLVILGKAGFIAQFCNHPIDWPGICETKAPALVVLPEHSKQAVGRSAPRFQPASQPNTSISKKGNRGVSQTLLV